MSHLIGSVQPGLLADLCIWSPASFGAKPHTILKAGIISWAMMGDPNASIPTVQPVLSRPMFGALNPKGNCITFVSQAALAGGVKEAYGLKKTVEAVKNCRNIGKRDMKFNDHMPKMKVDPENYRVEADGVHCTAEPAELVAVGQSVCSSPLRLFCVSM